MFYFIAPEIKLPKHDFLLPSPLPRPFLSLFFFPQPLIMTVSLKITGTNRIAHLWPGCHSSTESRQRITDNLGHEPRASAKPELTPVSSGRGITQGEPSPTGQAPRAPHGPGTNSPQWVAPAGENHPPTSPPSQQPSGGFLRPLNPEPEERPSFLTPPRPEVEPSQLADSPWTNRTLSSGKRAQPRPPAAPLGCCIPTAPPTPAHLVYSSRGPRRWCRK